MEFSLSYEDRKRIGYNVLVFVRRPVDNYTHDMLIMWTIHGGLNMSIDRIEIFRILYGN